MKVFILITFIVCMLCSYKVLTDAINFFIQDKNEESWGTIFFRLFTILLWCLFYGLNLYS